VSRPSAAQHAEGGHGGGYRERQPYEGGPCHTFDHGANSEQGGGEEKYQQDSHVVLLSRGTLPAELR
jgi:hypothetical protein